jgi:hypothetical protein
MLPLVVASSLMTVTALVIGCAAKHWAVPFEEVATKYDSQETLKGLKKPARGFSPQSPQPDKNF